MADRNYVTNAVQNVGDWLDRLAKDAAKANSGPDIGEESITRAQLRRAFVEGTPEFRERQVEEMGLDGVIELSKEIRRGGADAI